MGVPFNIASYRVADDDVGAKCATSIREILFSLWVMHIYTPTISSKLICNLPARPNPLPQMLINPAVKDVFSFKYEDFTLEDYEADSTIKAAIAV